MASPDSLLVSIQALHQAIAEHQDPAQKAALAQCLGQMMKVQAADHQNAQQAAQNPQAQQAGGGGADVDPRAALAAMLGQQ